MSTKAKKLVSICTLCALLLCMVIPTAFAAQVSSTATVDFGTTASVLGGVRTLYALPLHGSVKATGSTTQGSVLGTMWTRGAIFTLSRDSAETSGSASKTLYWYNDGNDSGTFWAECYSPNGNQAGYCSVWQYQ